MHRSPRPSAEAYERHLVRHAGAGAPDWVVSPGLGQVEAVRDRQAGMIPGEREGHGDLAVVLLAELATVLPRDADRMGALLRHAGVVDHPTFDGPMLRQDRQHASAHGCQHGVIAPARLGYEVVQRLMSRLHPAGRHPGGYGLDALALARQQQAGAVGPERRHPVSVPQGASQCLDIESKPCFAAVGVCQRAHNPLPRT